MVKFYYGILQGTVEDVFIPFFLTSFVLSFLRATIPPTYRRRPTKVIQTSFWYLRSELPDIKSPESKPTFSDNLRSAVLSKSANPLNLSPKNAIRAHFKAKSVDPRTYSPTSKKLSSCSHLLGILCHYCSSIVFAPITTFDPLWSSRHPTRSRRVMGSNPMWCLVFSEFPFNDANIYLKCYISSKIN